LRGLDLGRAGRVASLAAAYAVEQVGTIEHHYAREEFAARYAEAFGEPLPSRFWGGAELSLG
jgi:adenosine kinase